MSLLRELLGMHALLWIGVATLAVVGIALRSPQAALHRAAFGASLGHAVASLGAALYIVDYAAESPALLVAVRLLTATHLVHLAWLVCILAGWALPAVLLSSVALGVQTGNVLQWWTGRGVDGWSLVLGLALVGTQLAAFALLLDRLTI